MRTPLLLAALAEAVSPTDADLAVEIRLGCSFAVHRGTLRAIFGKDRVSMFEMNKHLSRHLS